MLEQVQVAGDEDDEVHKLCTSAKTLDGFVLRDRHQQHHDPRKVEIVTHIPEDIPRM